MSGTALESLKVRPQTTPKPNPNPPKLTHLCVQAYVEQIILDPKNRDILAIVKGARNGAVYGAKVRFPHALVYAYIRSP